MSKHKNVIFILLFNLLCIPTIVFGQGNSVTVPVSPNASALGEYGNTPVSLATGTPAISIPIFEIKGRHLSLPISLSYNASGIKTEEISSHIGIGWSLNAGGVIARAIFGEPDQGIGEATGTATNKAMWPRRPDYLPLNCPDEASPKNCPTDDEIMNLRFTETRPDIYYYNFLNFSGKFVFDYDGTYGVTPNHNFKIEFPWRQDYLVITDENGTKYYFKDVEYTYGNDENNYFQGNAATAYYITRIESFDSIDIIDFLYTNESYSYYLPEREAILRGQVNTTLYSGRGDWTTVDGQRLSRITTNFGYSVNFSGGKTRKDVEFLNNAYNIDGLTISYNGECIKRVTLDSDFLETNKKFNKFGTVYEQQNMEWVNYRLYLNGLKIQNCDYEEFQNYQFSYYGRDQNGKDELPNHMSFAQDHYGYYNGANGNRTLRPTFTGDVPKLGFVTIAGANRKPSFPDVLAGTLKSIKYPTGGSTVFVYEPHSENYGGFRIESILDYDEQRLIKQKKYEYSGFSLNGFPAYDEEIYYSEGRLHKTPYPEKPTTVTTSRLISSGMPNSLGNSNGYPLVYHKVKEIEPENGYVEYEYTFVPDSYFTGTYHKDPYQRYRYKDIREPGVMPFPDKLASGDWISSYGWPYAPKIDYSWKRGLLKSQKVYEEGKSDPVKTVINTYDYKELKEIYGVTWERTTFIGYPSTTITYTQNRYYFGDYSILIGIPLLKTQITIEDDISLFTEIEYDQNNNKSKIKETSSDGKSIETIFQYATSPEFSNSSLFGSNLLRNYNIVAPPLRTIKKAQGVEIYRIENFYTLENNLVVLKKISEYTNGATSGLKENIFTYNSFRKPVSIELPGEVFKFYKWGYNNIFPVVEVQGTSDFFYEDFEGNGSLGNAHTGKRYRTGDYPVNFPIVNDRNYVLSYWYLEGFEWKYKEESYAGPSKLLNLGSGIDDVRIHPVDARVIGYTYDPPSGVTSISDQNNVPTYYYYDTFGRLTHIKDAAGNILQHFKYAYKR